MYSYVTYNKKTGEIISIMGSTSDDVIDNAPSTDTYFCVDCDKEWSREGIEDNDIIFDTVNGEELSYLVEKPNKKPPYECPKCNKVLKAQSNYKIIKVTGKQMKRIKETNTKLTKLPDGSIAAISKPKMIKTYVRNIILNGD